MSCGDLSRVKNEGGPVTSRHLISLLLPSQRTFPIPPCCNRVLENSEPVTACCKRDRARSKLDFPEPLGPIRTFSEPGVHVTDFRDLYPSIINCLIVIVRAPRRRLLNSKLFKAIFQSKEGPSKTDLRHRSFRAVVLRPLQRC